MLLVISPAKTLDYHTPAHTNEYTQPTYLDHAQQLIERSRRYGVDDLMRLMEVSENIAQLNVARFRDWQLPFTPQNAKQAVLAFKGDVYTGLDADRFDDKELAFAQRHLRILSGLYGLLRPLDLMQPYRLEMGRRVDTERGSNLYQFWGALITEALNQQLETLNSEVLVNLASSEYFKSVQPKVLNARVITPEFKDYKNGSYKMLGVYAKKARGQLSRYVIQNQITEPEGMKEFAVDGYRFNPEMSEANTWVFTRKQ